MRRTLVGLILSLSLVGIANAQEDAKKELDKFQGKWKAEKLIFGGNDAPGDIAAKFVITCKGNEFIPVESPTDIATIKLDPSAKPKTIDLTEKNKKVSLGIYELSGDTLKLCFAEPGTDRPKMFESAKGSNVVYVVLKREK
ncbi:MAG TPA: TIGR03067 domain-containing protein [Gemmataceae bacterium]|nr:TIGR03067 domain-containing protein [Gemmataceae bacterium]